MECTATCITCYPSLDDGQPDYKLKQLDLQLFNEEKTEDPTTKRQQESREKGQVAKSMEVNSVFVVMAAFLALKGFGSYMYSELTRFMVLLFSYGNADFTINSIHHLFIEASIVFIKVCFPIMFVVLITALAVNFLQVGFLFSLEPLIPSFDKLNFNPAKALQKMFSKRSLAELVKSCIKIAIVGYFIYRFAVKETMQVPKLVSVDLFDSLQFIASLVLNLVYQISAVMIILAALDYFYQGWEHKNSLKMTKQEVKEEFKQVEGNPAIKSKIRERQRAMAMRRMMQEVPKADVVVTNPTHFAVALKYDKSMPAPTVVAKGQDLIAQRIKEIAKEHRVVIVENKPLARTLFASAEVGQIIPQDLYQAVAEVLAYVFRLKKRLS